MGTEMSKAMAIPMRDIWMVTGKVCFSRSATFTPGRVICSPKSPVNMSPSQSMYLEATFRFRPSSASMRS